MKKTQKIGFLTATAIVIANMVGTGVFTSLGFQIVEIKSYFALLMLWLVGGIIALSGALSYGELGAALPRSGGEYHFLSKIYHRLMGFLAGWVSVLIGFSAPTALAAMAMASYSIMVFDILNPVVLSCFIVLIISLVHSFNIKTGSLFQVVVTILKIILILFFIFAGLWLAENVQEVQIIPAKQDWQDIFTPAFAVSLIYVSYAFSGWNAAVYITGEIKNPEKNIPRSLITGTLTVTILYLLLNFVFLYSSPLEQMEGKVEVGFVAAENIFGITGGKIMATVIALLLVSSVSAMVWIGPRVTMVMGEDFRSLKFLGKTNKNGIPVYAIWFQAAITCILIITSTFEEVLVYSGFVLNLFTTLSVLGIFVLRYRQPHLKRPYRVIGYPFTPLVFVALSIWTLTYLLIEKPMESLAGLITVFLGIIFYFISKFIQK